MTSDHTGLRVRQQRNFISVREKPLANRGVGTLLHPKPIELPQTGKPQTFEVSLGYEAVPSTDVWQITVQRRSQLQLNRINNDPYVVHVAAALVDHNNRRVAPLVQSASGVGAVVDVEPGRYKIVISLGMPVMLKPVPFELFCTATSAGLRAVGQLKVLAQVAFRRKHLQALGLAWVSGQATLLSRTLRGQGLLRLEVGGLSRLSSNQRRPTHAIGVTQVSASAVLSAHTGGRLVAPGGNAGIWGRGRLAAVRWVSEPLDRRRAWFDHGVVVLNRAYVSLNQDPLTVWAQLEKVLHDLYPPSKVAITMRLKGLVQLGGQARLNPGLRGRGHLALLAQGALNPRSRLKGVGTIRSVGGVSLLSQARSGP